MPIITISRGSFSGGKMLAEAVARKLGYSCIDREHIVKKAAAWGVSQEDVRTALEKPPAFFGQSAHTKYLYLAVVEAALAEEVRSGKAVYHGLAGQLLLGKGSHVLRVRIIAPMEFRIENVQNYRKCTRDEAITYIGQMDEDRRKWTKFLYGLDWTDASLYDLVVNLEQMNMQEACELICMASMLKCFELSKESLKALSDLALSSRVKAKLAMDEATADCEFAIAADGKTVELKGEIVSPEQLKKIGQIVRGTRGVAEVKTKQLKRVARI